MTIKEYEEIIEKIKNDPKLKDPKYHGKLTKIAGEVVLEFLESGGVLHYPTGRLIHELKWRNGLLLWDDWEATDFGIWQFVTTYWQSLYPVDLEEEYGSCNV